MLHACDTYLVRYIYLAKHVPNIDIWSSNAAVMNMHVAYLEVYLHMYSVDEPEIEVS